MSLDMREGYECFRACGTLAEDNNLLYNTYMDTHNNCNSRSKDSILSFV